MKQTQRQRMASKRRDLEKCLGVAKGSMNAVSDEFIDEAWYKTFSGHGYDKDPE